MADTLKPDPSRIARRLSSSTTGGEEVFEYDLLDYEPQPLPETEEVEYEEVIDYIDKTGKKVQVPVYNESGKKIYRPTYNEQGVMTHDERGIMTFDEWKRVSDDVDWWPIAKEAVAGLARGFTKIPGKIEKVGFMEASANIPESFLAATEGLKLIGGGVGRFVAKPFRTEEEEDAAEYAAYKEFGNQIFRQLELRKSRMGDVARLFGAEDLAAVYDDGIDPEIADSLSLIFDPTYLVGGGLVKVGAAAAKQAPKVTNKYAKKLIEAAGKAAETQAAKQVGEFLAKPVTSTVSGIGTGVEKVGRGVQKIGEAGAKFAEKAPKTAKAAQMAVGAGTGAVLAPEGQELTGALGGAFGGKVALSSKAVTGLGEKIEKNAQRLGGAAQAAKINSLRTSGLGTVAKIRPMREEVAKQFVTLDNRVANRLLSGAGKLADTAVIGAGMGAGIGAFMPYDPTNPGYIAGMALGTLAAPAGMYSAGALNQLARVELAKGATPDAGLRLRLKETPMHQLASEAVVKRFLSALPEQQRVRFVDPDRGLSVADLANQAEAVDLFMGAMRDKGKDVNFFIGNTPEILEKTGGTAREGVAGFYDPDSNTVFVNTDAETPSFTLFHELFHPTERWSAMRKDIDADTGETVKSDPLQDIQTDLAQTIFGTYGPDGDVIQPGLYSKEDMLSFADQYNSRLYPDLSTEIKEVKAAIEAEKKKTLPEIDGIEPPETPEMRLLNRELEGLQTRQEGNQKELAAFDALPDATKRDYMARELMSDYFAMFGESARHGIIRKARNITLKKDYFKDKFLGMNIDRLKMATLGNLRKLLERSGVEFDLAGNPRGEMTATSALFKDRKTGRELVMSPQIEHLIAQYITEKDKLVNRVSETDDVGGSEITLNAKDVLKKNSDGTPKIPEAEIKRWASSGWLKTDKEGNVLNSTGGKWQPGQRPAFTTARERTRMDKNRVAALVTALTPVTQKIDADAPFEPTVKAKQTADGGTNFRGSYFDEQQMDAIMATPDDVIHPDLKSVIKTMNDAIKEGKGAPFLADYWKAITGRGYDSKARMKVQLFTPIGVQISSAGNFSATVFNIGYFENKINRWLGQSGKKKFWSDWADADGRVDVDGFRTDMMELLKTHYENDESKIFPPGMKKEKLYSFLGVKPRDLDRRDWNRAAKDFKLFISLRFDRMKDVTRGMGDSFPVNYDKVKRRFMPGEELTPGETGVRSPADGQRTTQRDIRSGSFRIDPPTGGAGFSAAISDAAQRHKFGAAVEVKQPEFYVNPETKLFLDPDQSAGLAITPDRDLVSVFKKPESQANIRDILAEASPYASTLDAFDVGGFLPNLYAENGFRPVARVPWNAEYAPPNWPKEMGEPDVVLMVRDPDGVLKLPDADYNQMRDQVPLYNDYDAALAAQQAARSRVDEVGVSDARFMPAERNDRKNRVSTRLPTAVAATEDPLASTLLIDSAAVFNLPPEKQKVMAGIITKYPNIRSSSKNLQPVADELKQQSIDNLLWLHDKVPADIRKRSKLWYDGARKITNGYTQEFQITNPAGAGVLAVLSPGKDWFMNVSLAERIIDTVQNKVGKPIDAKMMKQAKFRLEGKPAQMNEVKKMVGKKYKDLTPLQKAIWIRMYDEAYNSPNYEVISPEGRKVGLKKNLDGTNATVAHQSFPFIQKAISVLDDPSKENISSQLGTAHKIRNFYNNILLPKLAKEDVTIDTHAVAAALLRPLAQKSTEVQHGLGTDMPSSSITGAQGAYGIYADAYREAARQRGVLPREMQSITWEAVRGLFPKNMKTKQNKALADAIWTDYKRGRKTIDEARNEIEKLFGGIDAPDWYR